MTKMAVYWFRAKPSGWGWSAVSWQGWGIYFLYVFLVLIVFWQIDTGSHSASDTLTAFAVPFFLITLGLFLICRKTGGPALKYHRR